MLCKSFHPLFGVLSTDLPPRATVYSADIFQAGFAGNLMDREQGAKYRNTILAKGGSRPPMEYMEEYLGRKPTGVAFAASIML